MVVNMSLSPNGEFFVNTDDAFDLLYTMPEFDLSKLEFIGDGTLQFNQSNTELKTGFCKLKELYHSYKSILTKPEFDADRQKTWFMPAEYQDVDIDSLVLKRCTTQAETNRTVLELLEYKQRNLYPLLQYLNYMVETLRANNIVWGVGRGSSVASFVLYLLGVHKVDSLAYNLDPYEFFR